MLHMINKSPFKSDSLSSALRFAQDNDPILLIEDGVYGAAEGTSVAEAVKANMGKNPVYALQGDVKARGVNRLIDGVKVIDYDGFVELVEAHQVNSWL